MKSIITLRPGTKADLPQVLELVRELAIFERAPDEVINTVEAMERDGFGEQPVFGFYVGLVDGVIAGLSLWYYRYSTWKGKRLYLEDIIVTESKRGLGLGKMLFDKTLEKCVIDGCSGMVWQVLDWNEPAIQFYKKYNATFSQEWINCSVESKQIAHLLSSR